MNDTRILDGKALSQLIVENLSQKTRALEPKIGRCPGLGVILVGDNPASKTYVANKEKAAAKAGFVSFDKRLPNDASEAHLEEAIQAFNQD
ncbi:MAG: bifunctional 5,10-methylene-tetrahydrofolate dehydrogenase/5,10-methylene-tetrahydrofolate cyclohydrolase, partial [SAR324 cluster bacterium]|nr:bifunctional 5,10-methylene-tetrahydrofolate dehydrogenase/5,10-methylene-tetrahydrofolate cyclohydrolase [SAR324 cluster bacterium]